jgi:hypothetical protein
MNCQEAQELFGLYWDMDHENPERLALQAHLLICEDCAEEFQIWEESESMIRSLSSEDALAGPFDHVNRSVMDRIYSEQSWFMPVKNRTYHFSPSFRRNIAAVIACCMAMFVCGFFYLAFGTSADTSSTQLANVTGLLDTANAASNVSTISADFYKDVPVASISDPLVLQVVPTVPQYWVALSIFGMIMTLLILNWLSRTKS